MKKRIIAILLACIMIVGLAPAASAATTFPDVVGRWSEPYITDMAERGLYEGDNHGNFNPQSELTAAQAIAICARMGGYDEDKVALAIDDYLATVYVTIDGAQSWFHEDFAVAVAAGIVTMDELGELQSSGKLNAPLTREEFAPYLVRAMQLELGELDVSFTFRDKADISGEYEADVYVLVTLGIVEGDDKRNFNPQNNIRREDSATMFSRAVGYIEENGLILELADYETYDVTSGTVAAYEDGVLTVDTPLEGELTFDIEDTTGIYHGNVLSDDSLLVDGTYVRVCENEAGVFAVRVSDGDIAKYAGVLRDFDGETVKLNTGTRTVSLALNDRTRVMASGIVGTLDEVYDDEAGYSSAVAYVDPRGEVIAVEFEGGSRIDDVFLVSVGTDGTVTLEAPNGEPRTVTLSDGAIITIPEKTKLADFVGSRCEVRVANDDGTVIAITPDTETAYVSNRFVKTTVRTTSRTISISELDGTNEHGYKLSTEASVAVEGKPAELDDLVKGMYVRLVVGENETVTSIEAFDTARTYEVELTNITYGKTITLEVTNADGAMNTLSFESDDMPSIKRGLRTITADKLRAGDTLTINCEYWEIVSIEAAVVESNVAGTVTGITITATGTELQLTDENGEVTSYPIAATADIIKDGKTEMTVTSIQGMYAEAVLSGGEIVSVNVTDAESVGGELRGTILFVNSNDRTVLVEREDGTQATVHIDFDTNIMQTDGTTRYFSNLEAEQEVTVYYEVGTDGVFTATIVIIK